jgi:hypothetical protein
VALIHASWAPLRYEMQIVLVVVLIAWLVIGVVVVALLNLAKFVVRWSSRHAPPSVSSQSTVLPAVEGRDGAARSIDSAPPRHPGTSALPPPLTPRRSA